MDRGIFKASGVPSAPRRKPKLRGVSHLLAACVVLPILAGMGAGAKGATARWGLLVYGSSLFALFAISAFYHRPTWPPRLRDLIGRMDQSAIFLLIAGTYTPFGLLSGPAGGHAQLALVWVVACCGVVLSLAWPKAPKPLMAGIYVLYAWTMLGLLPSIFHKGGGYILALMLLGGLVYTIGAIVYARRKPDPVPEIFGYHEVFHMLVIAGAALHAAAVWLILPLLTT